MRRNSLRAIADWLGIAASTACAVHCMLVPIVLVTGTVLPASLLEGETFHLAMVWMILPAAIVAFGVGCWQHKDKWVFGLGAAGLTGIILSATVLHDLVGETGERVGTLVSAAVLIFAHYRNYQLCRSADCAHEESSLAGPATEQREGVERA